MMLSNKNISFIVGVGVALAFLAAAPKSWQMIDDVRQRQISANEKLFEWKNAYQALLPVNEKWRKAFPSGGDVKDIVSLYRLVDLDRHKLTSDVDRVVQSESMEVTVNGAQVGLQKLCISNFGSKMRLEAGTVKELRAGLRSLSERADIDLGDIEFSYDTRMARPVADITGLCLKVRVGDEV